MLASELIEKLQDQIKEHGDLQVELEIEQGMDTTISDEVFVVFYSLLDEDRKITLKNIGY